ncbi:WSD1 family O-acyltransferase [Mycobacterium leprae]|uniref:WSD1 family O-acyltransferase n=1 Tax=Mycobacterium leprae TaxID=1769 RepID=UPI001E594CFE|nr:WSD1 family O-acyltransferase [Mycobacterium leprae]
MLVYIEDPQEADTVFPGYGRHGGQAASSGLRGPRLVQLLVGLYLARVRGNFSLVGIDPQSLEQDVQPGHYDRCCPFTTVWPVRWRNLFGGVIGLLTMTACSYVDQLDLSILTDVTIVQDPHEM